MNSDHLKILRQGAEAWNAWIVEELSVKPGLPKPDLRGADLNGWDLREARLVQADLSRAKLFKAKLSRAILNEAPLFNADLREACLREAELVRAHLSKAKLIDANLSGAILNTANLNWANLRGANLMGASLIEADIRGVDLTDCRVCGISAWGLKLDEHTKQQNLIITRSGESELRSRGGVPGVISVTGRADFWCGCDWERLCVAAWTRHCENREPAAPISCRAPRPGIIAGGG